MLLGCESNPSHIVALLKRRLSVRKAHMDQVLAQAKVEISMTSKIWDGQRAYEKRLVTAMSKDKGMFAIILV
jgi:hypothetical protein